MRLQSHKFLGSIFVVTVGLAAPSLLLNVVGLGALKAPVGQLLLVVLALAFMSINRFKLPRKTILGATIVIACGLFTALLYAAAGLTSSVAPILGASIKVAIFFVIASVAQKKTEDASRAVVYAVLPILVLVLVANLIHNFLGQGELTRWVIDNRQISVLFGSFATSRIFVEGLTFFRVSGIFNEPGTFGMILYCVFLLFVTSREFSTGKKFLLFTGIISTFSLGTFISMVVASLVNLRIKVVLQLFRKNFFTSLFWGSFVVLVGFFLIQALSFVAARLSFGQGGRLIAGDNRFYDDTLPSNFLIGDGSYGGGFDSGLAIFQQFGLTGSAILFAPVITVACQLFWRGSFLYSFGLILFLAHKPNVLTPILIVLLAVTSAQISTNEQKIRDA
ncbi:hypothetical protein [Shimia sp. R9_3]|uniref:hypothetical protein n=1 Tax=Shimia sp. R9_3 TaxID=2821113 RepID=UPI001AD9C194|nr:hypothetical protein [Shimia sp. R9_3]MBO9399399.1 hypothetical protein [Shimia sp. R9_3]